MLTRGGAAMTAVSPGRQIDGESRFDAGAAAGQSNEGRTGCSSRMGAKDTGCVVRGASLALWFACASAPPGG